MIVDCHHHLLNEPDYADRLVQTCAELGIDRVCVSGLGIGTNPWLGDLSPTNDDVLRAMERYPDTIIGFGTVRLGRDDPSAIVDHLFAQGFRGLKTTRPTARYDDPAFWPVYARAQDLGMPILFHTGFVLVTASDGDDAVSSDYMRPVCLDLVARRFPRLRAIVAHLGMPWYEEAATLVRFHANFCVDWTGSRRGWRSHKTPGFLADLFYWDDAFGKVVFGTDVHWRDMAHSLQDQQRILAEVGVSAATRERILGGTVGGWLAEVGGDRSGTRP